MMQPLHFRSDYAHTKEGLAELSRLILDIFAVDISPLDRLGHDLSVVAFGWWQDGNLIANVSLYERRLWLAGEEVAAFGVQSVAVRPEWRGRGLFRDLMRRALDHADARVSLVILATGTPGLYRPFGFRQLQEVKSSSTWVRQRAEAGFRELLLNVDADIALLRDLFSRRVPTSLLASACDHPALFMLKASLTPGIKLLHLPQLDAVVAVKRNWRTMILLDVVAPSIPPLAAIMTALDFDGARVDVHLTPDRLCWTPDETQPVDNGYMVRGAFAPEGQAFMLSDMRI